MTRDTITKAIYLDGPTGDDKYIDNNLDSITILQQLDLLDDRINNRNKETKEG